MAQNFWTNPNVEPKRGFKFLVRLAEMDGGATWYASKADKPKFSVSETPHKYINHTFYYPGKVEWETVTITLVDPAEPDAAENTMKLLADAGYDVPKNAEDFNTIISKKSGVGALGKVTVEQIGSTSSDKLETWELHNAWLQAVNFSSLDYESEELSTIELTIRFDWASFKGKNRGYFTNG